MKSFITHILIFFVTGFVLAIGLEWVADQGLRTLPNTKFEEWKKLFDGDISSEIVILGSSRACVNYNPNEIEKLTELSTYNLGFNAASYNLQKKKYEIYLAYNAQPKVVIQNIDLSHFSPSNEVPETQQFIPFFAKKELRYFLNSYDNSSKELSFMPLVKYNTNLVFFVKGIMSFLGIKRPIFASKDGHTPVNKKYKADKFNLNRLKNADQIRVTDHDYNQVLTMIKDMALSSRVVLVWAPELEDRRVLVHKQMEGIQDKLKKLVAENEAISFLDYSKDSISFNKDYFYDSFHLNEKGANLFSNKLAMDLQNLVKQ